MDLSYLLKELFAERVRVWLTVFAIAWGTLAIALMLSVGQGLLVSLTNLMQQMGSNQVVLTAGTSSINYDGSLAGTQLELNQLDLNTIASLPGVVALSPEYSAYGTLTFQARQHLGWINGVSGNYLRLHPVKMQANGRFINSQDITQKRQVIVLGYDAAQDLFKDENPLGQWVQIGPFNFQVIGVTENYNQLMNYESPDIYLTWIPANVFTSLLGNLPINNVIIQTAAADSSALQQQIRTLIARHHGFAPNDQTMINFIGNADALNSIRDFFHGLQLFLGIIGAVTLLVASLGIANVMYIAVQKAIPAIGIRMACGAETYQIVRHYMLQALLATALGGSIGLLLALAVIKLANLVLHRVSIFGFSGLHFALSWPLFFAIACILGIVGLSAGIFPAIKASRIEPVEALRYE